MDLYGVAWKQEVLSSIESVFSARKKKMGKKLYDTSEIPIKPLLAFSIVLYVHFSIIRGLENGQNRLVKKLGKFSIRIISQ